MYLLYAVGIPYIYYTLTRWRTPAGHGLNWKEPNNYILSGGGTVNYGGLQTDLHQRDLEWHPDDMLRASVTGGWPSGEPDAVNF